jgi:hypothetical protein
MEGGTSKNGTLQNFTTPSSFGEPGDDVSFRSNGNHNIQVQSNEQFITPEILIYPNPAQNFVTVQGKNQEIMNRIVLYDLTGRLIQQVDRIEVSQYEMPLGAELSNGIYILRIFGEGFATTKQLSIAH